MLLGAACDPFWTQMNEGVCSDEFGNYLRPDGSAIKTDELSALLDKTIGGASINLDFSWLHGGGVTDPTPGDNSTQLYFPWFTRDPATVPDPRTITKRPAAATPGSITDWLSERSALLWLGGGVILFLAVTKGKR